MSRALKIYVFCSLAFAVAVPSLMLAIIFDFPATNAWDYCEPLSDNSGEIDFGPGDSCAIQWARVSFLFFATFAFVAGPLLLPVALRLGLRWAVRRLSRRAPS